MVTSYNWADVILNPFPTGSSAVWDMWTMIGGTREDKVRSYAQWVPVHGVGGSLTDLKPGIPQNKKWGVTFAQRVEDTINKQKAASPENKEFWEENVVLGTDISSPGLQPLGNIDIKLPDLGDLGKYALIGLLGLVALFVVTRKG